MTTIHYPLSTIHYPLSTIHYPLSTIHYPLSTTHYPLPTIHYPLSTIHYPLSTIHYPLPTTHYPLLALRFHLLAQGRPLVFLFELEPRLCELKLFTEFGVAFEEIGLRAVVGGDHFPMAALPKQQLLRRHSTLAELLAVDRHRFLQLSVNRRIDDGEIAVRLHAPDLHPLDRDE